MGVLCVLQGVQHVVNCDLRMSTGNAARAINAVRATSFFDIQQDRGLAGDLVRELTDGR